MTDGGGALAGVRVIDLTRILAGPFCTQMLGDHGAEIIKIEPPHGDDTRRWGPPFEDGESAYFNGVNRNKRTLALDLSGPGGRAVLLRLLERADVVIENFKAGQLDKWDLGYEAVLEARFPRLVYCQITGFGATGPYAGRPGFDAIAQAMSGLISINGMADGPPHRIGTPISDIATGLYAGNAILMALLERAVSGRGQKVELSLLDCSVSLLHPHAANYLMTGETPPPTGNRHPNIAPYEVFETAGGRIFIAGGTDRQFARLVAELGRAELADDPRFKDNAARKGNEVALAQVLGDLLAETDGHALAERLLALGIPAGPVLAIPEALDHAQVRAREMLVEGDGFRCLSTPIKMIRTPGRPRTPPPGFGAHSRILLAEAGYSATEIEALIAAGVVRAADKA
ncbi:MAG: CoA transferase [Alphaproteobacteria bacterium]|jgi:formyl-CoA transferase|nr:CoA transferase [Alphaproteobacteria bacterium]